MFAWRFWAIFESIEDYDFSMHYDFTNLDACHRSTATDESFISINFPESSH